MSHGRPTNQTPAEISLTPDEGWHCSHLYYEFDRGVLSSMHETKRLDGRDELVAVLDPQATDAPLRLQTSVVSGQKADFALMIMDPDPLKIDAVHQRIMASQLGPALRPVYSFVSLSEISEYVPSVEQLSLIHISEPTRPY